MRFNNNNRERLMKGIIFVDIGKCVACKSCELRCAIEHSKSKELCKAIYECPLPEGRVKVESEAGFNVPLQCRQCEDAPCIKVCPSKAIERLDPQQPVLITPQRCIGCKLCIVACPFGVIKMSNAEKAVIKCDMCVERLKEGNPPACVMACPTKALKFKSVDAISKDKRKEYLVDITKDSGKKSSSK